MPTVVSPPRSKTSSKRRTSDAPARPTTTSVLVGLVYALLALCCFASALLCVYHAVTPPAPTTIPAADTPAMTKQQIPRMRRDTPKRVLTP
eukprot:CAMPEP_0173380226 /NCGR_PEP_ID=MMETSP1356-20130122/2952_1 /TAXON_ID=77927 ORGANISM="Hemiselmis virescens, Strain PCC157" /NCGR_SAMPLE_ID=MMETSP1356 /ASSEMBLY_ACC=CAM_ASM_000847 /LENGTH=90 /DNA_ID=CAMNT_0014333747 /DNA_START=109 /DNA_END=378 /DNA_ORIENTATION=+